MRTEPILIAILMGLCSCKRPEPAHQQNSVIPDKAASPDPTLAAAQLALANSHLANKEPDKAIPYLQAAGAAKLLAETLASHRFHIPTVLLRHPAPVLHFTGDPGRAIFVALGGTHPTVVRWNLSDTPEVSAVLFPTDAKAIPHISLSPNGLHLLVQRDSTNLLCHAETLKPIANLGAFPANLDPGTCQPFTANGLLLAHPVKAENGGYLWSIRDTTTGEILRSELLPQYPEPREASFDAMDLTIVRSDGNRVTIPILGDAKPVATTGLRIIRRPAIQPTAIKTAGDTIALLTNIPSPPALPLPRSLLSAISGHRLDPATQTLTDIPVPERLEILAETFPENTPRTLKLYSAESALNRRLAAAYPEDFPQLSVPQRANAEIIRKTFETGDPAAISAVIDSAEHGLPLATALFLAIESQNPSFIERTVARASDLPPALRDLAAGKTDSPDPASIRLEQDWLGYESPDFTPLFQKASERKSLALSKLSLPGNPSSDDIDSLILKLADPRTEAEIGRHSIAALAIHHAATLASNPELATHAQNLSSIARRFGANPAACLRTNATAHTTLGDFTSAHRTWIALITDQPEADHLPSDYAEAAYTAFETGDARQAMEILNTGLFRFPNDVAFAIRAGWIALLTDHSSEALVCLTRATKLGLPPAEIENTTALLAITHSQLGDTETAASYLAQLRAISPKWEQAESIAALPWPESFKSALAEIISQTPENEPVPSPENDPTDTAPPSGGFPIPEPPLPER
ncbi:hypothetical protein HZ994_03830 [Akkermansiaceae bacterium]|nr:hypothetical protein HZ994_03830 [Akkermansiaceae bacterium]